MKLGLRVLVLAIASPFIAILWVVGCLMSTAIWVCTGKREWFFELNELRWGNDEEIF